MSEPAPASARPDPLDVVRRRLVTQRLAGDRFASVADAVGWLGAMQAQEFAEVKWSLAERIGGCTDADVETAFARGDIVRTHALRPTWHLLAREDARWILRLTRPRVHALNAYWYRQADLDAGVFSRADHVLRRRLTGAEPRTRTELAGDLAREGIVAQGPRLAYILMHAELEELICNGPRRGRQHTYALFDDRVPSTDLDDRSRESAFAEFVWRYFRSHGPATVRDFTTWSSLPVAETRATLAQMDDRLEALVDDDGTAWYSARSPDDAEPPDDGIGGAFLLPMYDETIVAYQDLRVVLAHPVGRAALERAIVIDGRTVGTWKRTLTRQSVVVEAALFGELTEPQSTALRDAVERFGRFLGLDARLEATMVA